MVNSTEILRLVDVDRINGMSYEDLVDFIEKSILDSGSAVSLPLIHTFTKGLYSREMNAPKGAIITSKVHKEEHQFILLKGEMIVIDEQGAFKIKAPFHGITKPNTSRIGLVIEDIVWTTFHSTGLIEDREYTEDELSELLPLIEDSLVEQSNKQLT